ncbi:unnamed protein product [Nezara viridula]|uniref:Uncharacterized protein n=1 Tax=Nezara viridula TaxID=85310 RepID=A0A9P0H222_NEZVI|nr:unnamed protein product [Nezara viridula]
MLLVLNSGAANIKLSMEHMISNKTMERNPGGRRKRSFRWLDDNENENLGIAGSRGTAADSEEPVLKKTSMSKEIFQIDLPNGKFTN